MSFRGALPDARTADLLAAALLDSKRASEAWARWSGAVLSPLVALRTDSLVARPLLPLLYDSVRRNALPVDDEMLTYLRSAYVTESLRSRAYREIVAELTALLTRSEVHFLLVKGAAIGELDYAHPALRHAHDIEVLVHDVARVVRALHGSRFQPARGDFVHDSGLPIRVHERLFAPSMDLDESMLRESPRRLPGGAPTLNAAHALALTLIHAGRSVSRDSCRWVCDAHALVHSSAVDWSRFTAVVIATGASITTHAQTRWLHKVLGLPIPADTLAQLAVRAGSAGIAEQAIAFLGIHAHRVPLLRRFSRRALR